MKSTGGSGTIHPLDKGKADWQCDTCYDSLGYVKRFPSGTGLRKGHLWNNAMRTFSKYIVVKKCILLYEFKWIFCSVKVWTNKNVFMLSKTLQLLPICNCFRKRNPNQTVICFIMSKLLNQNYYISWCYIGLSEVFYGRSLCKITINTFAVVSCSFPYSYHITVTRECRLC